LPSMTECAFVVDDDGVQLAIEADAPMKSVAVATESALTRQEHIFELPEPAFKFTRQILVSPLSRVLQVEIGVCFTGGGEDSCIKRGFVEQQVFDCLR